MRGVNNWLSHHSDIGILLLRGFVGIRLIYGVIDNVMSWQHMLAFRDFLAQFNFPFPLASACISVYCQLIAGVFMILGFNIRFAAILMIINFLIAIAVVHRDHSFEIMTPALSLLFISILFLFQGAGRYAVSGVKREA